MRDSSQVNMVEEIRKGERERESANLGEKLFFSIEEKGTKENKRLR